ASNALLRPGPLDAGMHRVYMRRKRGEEPVKYILAELEPILKSTYGVITYQEQVMRIAQALAGISLAEADVLRKAVGKKDAELIRSELGKFIEKSVARGHDRESIEEIASQLETFGRYGFGKSHSVAYSIISYHTAWLKTHHPADFMAALDLAIREASLKQEDLITGQASLFGASPDETQRVETTHVLPNVQPWTESERLAKEKEILGFYISGHPLERFRAEAEIFATHTVADLGS